jgi:hypothetical protein
MARVLTPTLETRAALTLHKERELPIAGEILVKPGDVVEANQVIARAALPGAMMIERLSEKLGFSSQEILAGLKVKEGDSVFKGQVLFSHRGLFGLLKTEYHAPVSGVVELISSAGHISIRMESRPVELRAYISGTVDSVEEGRSAVISARAAWIQGIFGVGGERSGSLLVIEKENLLSHDLDGCDGKIIVIRGSTSGAMLREAMQRGAVGFVCGSIDDQALKSFLGFDLGVALTGDEPISMSVIVTEGFGSIPMSETPWQLLIKHNGQPASINGTTQVRAGAQRPEIVIPLKAEDALAPASASSAETLVMEVGSAVRIIRYPYFGLKGVVTELPHELMPIATGAEVRVLRVKLADDSEVTVPRANIELVVT